MPLQAVESSRLYRQIAEQLRGLITGGEFEAGTRLPAERDLAKQLGVSRPSVREALIALEVEGWVEVRTGSGIYVQPPRQRNGARAGKNGHDGSAEWGPLKVMQARELVESEVAASSRICCSALAIAEACGNEVLSDTVRSYWSARHGPLFSRLGDYFENPASWSAALVEHAAVLEAIRARDAQAARDAMQQHLKKATSRYSASWRRANHS